MSLPVVRVAENRALEATLTVVVISIGETATAMNWFDAARNRLENWSAAGGGPCEAPGNFTPRAQQVLALARKEADRFNHHFVGTEHLLLGLIKLGQGVAVNVLMRMGLDLETVQTEVEKQVGTGPDQKIADLMIPYTPRVRKVLALAAKEAKALNHTYVGTEHILLGLLREGDGVAARVLKNLHVDVHQTRQEILRELDPNFSVEDAQDQPSTPTDKASIKLAAELPQNPKSSDLESHEVDTRRRYDVYCTERNQEVVYRDVRFRGARKLFPEHPFDVLPKYIELEHPDGKSVFVAGSSIFKFSPHDGDSLMGGPASPKSPE